MLYGDSREGSFKDSIVESETEVPVEPEVPLESESQAEAEVQTDDIFFFDS